MLRALVYIVPVALAVFALIEMSRSTVAERLGLSPWAWAAIIVLLPVIGPVVWLVLSRRASPGPRPAGPTSRPRPPRRSGPVAPDDDPDFLFRLEQQQRRRRPEGGGGSTGAPGTDDAAGAGGTGSDESTGSDGSTEGEGPGHGSEPTEGPDKH